MLTVELDQPRLGRIDVLLEGHLVKQPDDATLPAPSGDGPDATIDPDLPEVYVDVVGPVCESGDTFTKQRALPPIAEGELVAFRSAGAYGAVMASEYNTRPLIPEVLVHEHQFAVIRARPSYEEIINRDSIPSWLEG